MKYRVGRAIVARSIISADIRLVIAGRGVRVLLVCVVKTDRQ